MKIVICTAVASSVVVVVVVVVVCVACILYVCVCVHAYDYVRMRVCFQLSFHSPIRRTHSVALLLHSCFVAAERTSVEHLRHCKPQL